MPPGTTVADRFREIFRSAFFELSWKKKKLLQLALGLGVLGLVGQGVALARSAAETGDGGAWSWTALTSGVGCVLGFAVGAAFRIFLKLGLLLGLGVAAILFGLSWLGWVDLPWSSFGEIAGAVADFVQRECASLQDLVSGYLPSSALTGLGLASGVTQRPDMDPHD